MSNIDYYLSQGSRDEQPVVNGDIEVIKAEPHHEPYEGHHHQGRKQALGVEECHMKGVSLPGQGEVTRHGGVCGENVKLRHRVRRPLELDLEDVT